MLPNVTALAFLPGVVAGLIAYIITPFVIKFAKKINIIDDPSKNKHPKVIHTYPVPRGGGLAIYVGILFAALIFIPHDLHLYAILTGLTLLVGLGILDDKYNLNPYLRIGAQLIVAAIPVMSGIGITFINNPFGGIINLNSFEISAIFGILWLTFLMNILNMGAKGVDGQLPGVTGIAAIIIAALSLKYSADITQWPTIILASITAGAFLGFLPWNAYPQRIMPSYSGSTMAGYLLGVLSILSTAKVGTLLVVLGIPIVDTAFTITRRIVQGKSPVWGDRGHLHHKLLDFGLSKTQTSLFYWITTALLGLLALQLNSSDKLYTIVGVVLAVGGLLLWLQLLLAHRQPKKS